MIDVEDASWVNAGTCAIVVDARRFENGERCVAGQIDPGVAARHAVQVGIDAIEARVKALAALLRRELRASVHCYNNEPEVERFVRALAG